MSFLKKLLGGQRENNKETIVNMILAFITIAGFALSFYLYSISFRMFMFAVALSTSSAIALIMRLIVKATGEVKIDPDLLFSLLHMRALATGKVPVTEMLDVVSRGSSYREYGDVYRKIAILAKEWGYSIADAITYIGREIREKAFREFLLRLATVARLGEDLEPFLNVEYNTIKSEYENQYVRAVNSLRVLLGVYASSVGAVSFAISSFLLLAFFYGGKMGVVEISFFASFASLIAMALVIIRLTPKDYFENEEEKPDMARYIDFWSLGATLASIALLTRDVLIKKSYFTSFVAALGVLGVLLLPAGILATSYEGNINDIDAFFPVFIRSLGSHLSIVPSLSRALRLLTRVELGKLKKPLRKLYAIIESGISPDIAWKKFARETGSELVRRGTKIFSDAISRGGDLTQVGVIISDHTNFHLALRRSRAQIASGFISTVIIMHISMVSLLELVLDIMVYFGGMLTSIRSGVNPGLASLIISGSINEPALRLLILVFSSAATFLNAYLIAKSKPGSLRSFWLYLSILSMLTSAALLGTRYGVWWFLRKVIGSVSSPMPSG